MKPAPTPIYPNRVDRLHLLTGVSGYDAESHVTAAGGVTYSYDGDGQRVEKSSGKLYWGAMPLAEIDSKLLF